MPLRNLAGHNLAGEESKGDSRKIRQLPVERCPVPYFGTLFLGAAEAAEDPGERRYGGYCGIGLFPAPPGAFCPPRPEKSGTFSAGSACLCVAPVCVANATGRRRQASLREQLQHLGSAVSNQPSAR